MKYWFDTEFIEDGKTIDLISIGIVAEDGREYYAVSTEFDSTKASNWVKENVLSKLPLKKGIIHSESKLSPGDATWQYDKNGAEWKDRVTIAKEIKDFVGKKPIFWAYYASYDWVALCQLYGPMIDLPDTWPMYCRDVKQLADELGGPRLPNQTDGEHNALEDARWNLRAWRFLEDFRSIPF